MKDFWGFVQDEYNYVICDGNGLGWWFGGGLLIEMQEYLEICKNDNTINLKDLLSDLSISYADAFKCHGELRIEKRK